MGIHSLTLISSCLELILSAAELWLLFLAAIRINNSLVHIQLSLYQKFLEVTPSDVTKTHVSLTLTTFFF